MIVPQNPPYLWVLDQEDGFLGLLKGPFPIRVLQSGSLACAAVTDIGLSVVRLNLEVWQHRISGDKFEFWWVVKTDLPLEILKQIKHFRYSTKKK